jgi:hypothetical protein
MPPSVLVNWLLLNMHLQWYLPLFHLRRIAVTAVAAALAATLKVTAGVFDNAVGHIGHIHAATTVSHTHTAATVDTTMSPTTPEARPTAAL